MPRRRNAWDWHLFYKDNDGLTLKPAVVGMIGTAFLSVGRTVFFPSGLQTVRFTQASFWVFLGIFAVSVVLVFKKVNPIKIILLSAAVGIGAGYSLNL